MGLSKVTDNKILEELRVWELIQINAGEDGEYGVYEARIEDFINGGLVISRPIFLKGKTLLREGMLVLVQFTRNDASYSFYSKISNASTRGTASMILSPPTNFKRVQRRMFVRIDVDSPASYAEMVPMMEWENWEDKLKWQPSRCINISGGGAMITLKNRIRIDSQLLLRIKFLQDRELFSEILARCVRCSEDEKNIYAGLEFLKSEVITKLYDNDTLNRMPRSILEFNSVTQQKLVAYVFAEQVELRRKGLL